MAWCCVWGSMYWRWRLHSAVCNNVVVKTLVFTAGLSPQGLYRPFSQSATRTRSSKVFLSPTENSWRSHFCAVSPRMRLAGVRSEVPRFFLWYPDLVLLKAGISRVTGAGSCFFTRSSCQDNAAEMEIAAQGRGWDAISLPGSFPSRSGALAFFFSLWVGTALSPQCHVKSQPTCSPATQPISSPPKKADPHSA